MLDSIKQSMDHFSRDPVAFMVPTFLYPVLMLITLGAFLGVLLIFFFLFSLVGFTGEAAGYVLGAIAAVLGIVYMIVAAGYKGSMVNEYNNATEREPVGLEHFLKYAFRNAPNFFIIGLIKTVIIGFLVTPIFLLYYFVLWEYHDVYTYLAVLIAMALIFLVEFVFSFSYVAYVVRKVSPITAMIISFNTIKERHVHALVVYVVYAAVAGSTSIPLLNILTYLVFYPIAYTSLITFFKR